MQLLLPITIHFRHNMILLMKLTFCEYLQNSFILIHTSHFKSSWSLHSSSDAYQSQCFLSFLFYFFVTRNMRKVSSFSMNTIKYSGNKQRLWIGYLKICCTDMAPGYSNERTSEVCWSRTNYANLLTNKCSLSYKYKKLCSLVGTRKIYTVKKAWTNFLLDVNQV